MNNINPNTFNYSKLANTLTHLKNPNKETGTLLIELPADIGRAYSGYKRGGIIEAGEKLRKEVMSAAVWLFGIPAFNKLGNWTFEKISKLPMNIDYSNSKDGEDVIRNSIEFLATGKNPKNLDISELQKYIGKINIKDTEKTIKKVKGAKQFITIAAWALNCLLMGIVLPKFNQYLTRKKLNKQANKQANLTPKFVSMQEFQEKAKKDNISFKGISDIADIATYALNNNAKARLISTDIPMIMGRCATARNKYEALEIGIMDSLAILFYNFTLGWTQDLLNKICGNPGTNAKICELIAQQDNATLNSAINDANGVKNVVFILENAFNEDVVNEIYKHGTNGKFGKINRFVKDKELTNIQNSVQNFLINISKKLSKNPDGTYNTDNIKNIVKNINKKNAIFYTIGTIVSFLGLGVLIPKIAYAITKKITGKDGFVGIQEEENK